MERSSHNIEGISIFSRIFLFLIIILGAFIMIVPFMWMFVTSLKEEGQVFTWPPQWIPKPVSIHGYISIFNIMPLIRYILNTIFVSTTVTIGALFFSSLAGFAFSKYEFPGRDLIFFILLSTLMIPGQVTLIPVFLIVKNLGWLNNYLALIVPALGDVFGIFLMRQFISTIPTELIDAARIDGCSEFRIYGQILLPLIKPALATLGIFVFMGQWNNLFWPLIVINEESMKTLQLGLAGLRGTWMSDWSATMAGATVATIPIIVIFLFLQKYFIEGLTLTGMKA